jgi:hypothetical protein
MLTTAPRNLNAVQLMLLKLFNRDMTTEETKEIEHLLLNYLDDKLQKQLDIDMVAKKITQKDLDKQLNKSNRIKQMN